MPQPMPETVHETMSTRLTRRTPSLLVLAACASLFGCGCGSTSTQERASEPSVTSEPTTTPEPTSAPVTPPPTTPPEVPPTPSEPAPPLTITTHLDRDDVQLSITNETDASVSFASRLLLESRAASGEWTEVTSRGRFVARLDAERPLPECAELVRGASLELSFPSLAGDPAPQAASLPGGEHRFVVTSCNGTGRTEGAPFTASR